MNNIHIPLAVVGDWYRDMHGGIFEVVAVDSGDGTVEIQTFDGTVEELDAENWAIRALATAEPPKDWSGSLDIERVDYGVDLDDTQSGNWSNPLDYLDRAESTSLLPTPPRVSAHARPPRYAGVYR